MDLDHLHLLNFEKRVVAKIQPRQLARFNGESESRPPGKNESLALSSTLILCAFIWQWIAIPISFIALALQITVGLWSLLGYAGVAVCLGMSRWRSQQAKRIGAILPRRWRRIARRSSRQ